MITGIGTDIVELSRIRRVNKDDRLARRILSHTELDKYNKMNSTGRKIEFLAGRFAVKEAYSKALGSGIGATISFREISCTNDANGKPALENDMDAHISISHSKEYAMAVVVLETN